MKNTKPKRYKILPKKRSERKPCYETSSSSLENENKSIELLNINFLLEILGFLFFILLIYVINR